MNELTLARGWVWIAGLWLLWAPGFLLARAFRWRPTEDWTTAFAGQLGLGLAFWPTLMLGASVAGWRWTAKAAQALVLFLSTSAGLLWLWAPSTEWAARARKLRSGAGVLAGLGLVLALTALVRVLHIYDLVLPAWVDSVKHTMLARLIVEQGTLPETYAPFVPGAPNAYHWGFHTLIAWLAWTLDRTQPLMLAQLMLEFGQVLNTLVVLMLYAGGRALFGSRHAGLLSAVLGGLISWYPAYYVSWGRYTQLTGMLLLPVVAMAAWRLRRRPHWGTWGASVVLGVGLVLTHVRVAAFACLLLLVIAAWLLAKRQWRPLAHWTLVAVTVFALTLPWTTVLLRSQFVDRAMATSLPAGENDARHWITWELLWVPHNRELMALASGGITGVLGLGGATLGGRVAAAAWGGLLALAWTRRGGSRSQRGWLLLVAWCGLTALLLNLPALGLPAFRFAHNDSAVIALFLPLSLAGGGLLAGGCTRWLPRRWQGVVVGGLVIVGSVWGAGSMVHIVNPKTVLAHPPDVHALRWIEANVAPDAKFAVDAWPWLLHTYAGTDGGYWIPVLTGRETTVPPGPYGTLGDPAEATQVNAFLTIWSQAHNLEDDTLVRVLQDAGVTHIYLRTDQGAIPADRLLQHAAFELLYTDDVVYIFEVAFKS
jgi:hypothetical protein